MFPDHMTDQAEGLRRLLLRSSARIVTVAAARAGTGATSVVVNMAAALARTGKDVLVLDENLSHANVGNMLALKPRYDLLNAVRGDKALREIMLHPQPKVRLLPGARAFQALPQLSAPERERLLQCLAEASRGADIVLVDAAAAAPSAKLSAGKIGGGLSSATAASMTCSPASASLAPDQPLLVALNASSSSITESYALIKRLAMQEGRRSFEIVVNKARDIQEARAVADNMAQVARRHLGVRVEFLGYIPLDDKLERATQLCRPVVEAFPAAPSALAFGELGRNLALLPAAGDEEAGELPGVMQRLMRQAGLQNVAHATS